MLDRELSEEQPYCTWATALTGEAAPDYGWLERHLRLAMVCSQSPAETITKTLTHKDTAKCPARVKECDALNDNVQGDLPSPSEFSSTGVFSGGLYGVRHQGHRDRCFPTPLLCSLRFPLAPHVQSHNYYSQIADISDKSESTPKTVTRWHCAHW